jgi:hypothetical protein
MPILSLVEVLKVNKSTSEFDGIYIPTANATLVFPLSLESDVSMNIIHSNGVLGRVVYLRLSRRNISGQQCSMVPR